MKRIGIIIRGKHSMEHVPGRLEQHADVVLSDGNPIGYFGEGGNFQRVGMFMNGAVYNYAVMAKKRPEYVDIEIAHQGNLVSTLCLIQVDDETARKFDNFWRYKELQMEIDNPGFSLLGNNCSTNAAEAFRHAGLIDGGIPGLDTPQNLFTQLRAKLGGNFQCVSGFIGFSPEGNQMKILYAPAEK